MPVRYITIEDEEIVVDNNGIMLSESFKPKGGGSWKLIGYVTPDKKLSSKFKPGYVLYFLDATEEWISYRFEEGRCRILEKPLQHYASKQIKEMKRELDKRGMEPNEGI